MNWSELLMPLTKEDIDPKGPYITDTVWQDFRISLKGLPTAQKYKKLVGWLERNGRSHKARVQVANYVNALKRGGQVKS